MLRWPVAVSLHVRKIQVHDFPLVLMLQELVVVVR